jgi:subtilisin-like proprotein convertase family protein
LGSNEWQGGTASKHYQCGLLQADGSLDLENNRSMGDAGDLYGRVDGIALSHSTLPASLLWDGSDSGLQISKISSPGKVMTFVIGPAQADLTVRCASALAATIPDSSISGLRDVIKIDQEGKVTKLNVSVDISHSNIGNLRVELLSPGGKRAILHNRTGLGKIDLQKSYDSKSTAALITFIGQPLKGKWILTVRDLVKRDTGKLNKWSLELGY